MWLSAALAPVLQYLFCLWWKTLPMTSFSLVFIGQNQVVTQLFLAGGERSRLMWLADFATERFLKTMMAPPASKIKRLWVRVQGVSKKRNLVLQISSGCKTTVATSGRVFAAVLLTAIIQTVRHLIKTWAYYVSGLARDLVLSRVDTCWHRVDT